jgi:hypothetical protein
MTTDPVFWLACIDLLIGWAYWRIQVQSPWIQRAQALAGLLSLLPTFLFGIYPNIITVFSIIALPGMFMMASRIFVPQWFSRGWPRAYLLTLLVLSAAFMFFDAWWVSYGCRIAGKCL